MANLLVIIRKIPASCH